jgi:hypothetical protein
VINKDEIRISGWWNAVTDFVARSKENCFRQRNATRQHKREEDPSQNHHASSGHHITTRPPPVVLLVVKQTTYTLSFAKGKLFVNGQIAPPSKVVGDK